MKQNKLILALALIIIVAAVPSLMAGCSRTTRSTPQGKYEIVRKAVLGNTWQMYQLRITLAAGADFDIDLLNLAGADKVDGYFYPETGAGGSLAITSGNNIIYKVDPATLSLGGNLSDRFSFPANQPAGTAYILTFHNGGTAAVTEFVELIYPKTGSIRGPIDIK